MNTGIKGNNINIQAGNIVIKNNTVGIKGKPLK
jgi:hypothetical protein